MAEKNPTQHNMTRRSAAHDYSRPGIYHVTIHVAEGMGQPLGVITGSDADAAAVALSAVGTVVERELLTAITTHYPMVTVDTYVVMPEHLHFILVVRDPIVSSSGRKAHLGQVIAGFKTGCNRAFWAITGQGAPTATGTGAGAAPAAAAAATGTPAAKPQGALPAGAETGAGATPAAKPQGALPAGAETGGTGTPAAKPQGALPAGAETGAGATPADVETGALTALPGAATVAGGFAARTGGTATPAAKPQGTLPAGARTGGTATPAAKPQGALPAGAGTGADGIGAAPAAISGKARYSTARPPLFAHGYCDVMPVEPGQLDQQRAYIRNNPKSRWLRTHDRARLQLQRGGIDTAVTPSALRGYLRRVCPPALVTAEVFAAIERRLLLAGDRITCHSYGDRALLQRRLLPVVCHRRDNGRLAEQKGRCLDEAVCGAVLVSPRIANGEQAIMDEAIRLGFPVVLIADNGFPTVYHPSTDRIALCAEGRMLLVTPWQYEYRGKNETVTVPFCKTMNCVAQALCRLKDDWWKT